MNFTYQNWLRTGLSQYATPWSQGYGYDLARRLTSVTSPAGVFNYAFDPVQLQRVNDGNGDTAGYNYLANSPLVGQIALTQNGTVRMTTTKQYDDVNRLTSISSQPSGPGVPPASFAYNYNSANQRTQDKLADGSYWVYQYDSLGQVISGSKHFWLSRGKDTTPKNIRHQEAHAKEYCHKNIKHWTHARFGWRCAAGTDKFGGEWQF